MFCGNCGTQMNNGEKFCPNCGAPVAVQDSASQENNTRDSAVLQHFPTVKGRKGLPKPFIIIAAVIVVFIAMGAIFDLFGGDSDTGKQAKPYDILSKPKSADDLAPADLIGYVPETREITGSGTGMVGKEYLAKITEWKQTYNLEGIFDKKIAYSSIDHEVATMNGIPNIKQCEYCDLGINGNECAIMSGDTVWYVCMSAGSASGPLPMSHFKEPRAADPLIIRTAFDPNEYLLIWKCWLEEYQDYMYIIFTAFPDDPNSDYWNWYPEKRIEVLSPQYCGFLNGQLEVEIVEMSGIGD